ncbi:VOC family protein [Streptomyces sp. NBC_00083]|uniref:VOC family protein n=1 Tax=Streptomyces sp. NBC_00083 TaxID=2975647 RepID=UPI00224EC307|nr:VOC family protein [Streptomyces sp. NBC_00083]MCX5383779.1 VOC family protein [Streptomyces sp. NBC_00083]
MAVLRARLGQLVVDCADPGRLARFWAALLGGHPVLRGPSWAHVDPPGSPRLAFQKVPEEKAVKNRLHLDLAVEDVGRARAAAVRRGARPVGATVTDEQGVFQVMTDPEGNEFCFVESPDG